jgi:hypothetical protein
LYADGPSARRMSIEGSDPSVGRKGSFGDLKKGLPPCQQLGVRYPGRSRRPENVNQKPGDRVMAKSVGKNVSYEVNAKNQLVITVDLNKENGPSKSGKTTTIGTTNGNTKMLDKNENEVIFGLNVYKYPTEE